jgi:hypothetical protein
MVFEHLTGKGYFHIFNRFILVHVGGGKNPIRHGYR